MFLFVGFSKALFVYRNCILFYRLITCYFVFEFKNQQSKCTRRRVANFTADEKALLVHLIKKRPVIESKLTDGKTVAKKRAAWDMVMQEFNSNVHVHKRDTVTLKRAWDNLKAFTRKARATQGINSSRAEGGSSTPPQPPTSRDIIRMVEEAAPAIICEIKNTFDGSILGTIENSQEIENMNSNESTTFDTFDINQIKEEHQSISASEDQLNSPMLESQDSTDQNGNSKGELVSTKENLRKPTDYIRQEAVMRITHLENKKKIEIQLLKTQLEVEELRKQSVILEHKRNKILLEKAELELAEIKKRF